MLSFVYIAHESQQNKCYHIATWVCPMNPIPHPVACCGMLLGVVAKSLKTVKLWANNSQHSFFSITAEA